MFWIIILTFHAALKTGELIKLEKKDFQFGHDDDKKYVVVTLREVKNQPGLTQQPVFRMLPNTSYTPYETCVRICKRLKSQQDWVFPMKNPSDTKQRSRFIYSWFFYMKHVFVKYIKFLYNLIILVEKLTFYIFRTSFIGLAVSMDVSESEIKTRSRHSRNFSVFRDTYIYITHCTLQVKAHPLTKK